jgi:glutamate decarboxylase
LSLAQWVHGFTLNFSTNASMVLTLGHTLATTLADDITQACEVLAQKGGLHEHDRRRVKTGTGY